MSTRTKFASLSPSLGAIGDVSQLRPDELPSFDLMWIELTKHTLEEGVRRISELTRIATAQHHLPPNILVIIRSLHLPARERERIRESVTSAGATFFEIQLDDDIAEVVNTTLLSQ